MDSSQQLPGPLAEFARQLLAGRPYAVIRHMGRGAMGEIFEVEHTEMGRRFVLKSPRPRYEGNQRIADRMRIEAQSAARLKHPNIVEVVDFWTTREGFPCVAMEYLEGASLTEHLIKRTTIPVLEATRYASQLLSALATAHALGIVHRDIKPDNLFLQERAGRPPALKVLDFGIARVLPDAKTGAPHPLEVPTETGTLVGTPRFMSPEALEGLRVDHLSDIYSAGLVLYVMLAGVGPFDRVSWQEAASSRPRPPSELADTELPPELDRIVLKAIEEAPGQRYQSASEFQRDVDALRAELKGRK